MGNKMKIAFINPSLRPDAKRKFMPVGLAYVMTAVQKAGFDFDLIDIDINCISDDEFCEIIKKEKYDFYGIGCIVTGFRYVEKYANLIKKVNSDALIIAGNSVASSIPEILLKNTQVDVAIMGEGDLTIVDLIQTLFSKGKDAIGDVKGLYFKENSKITYTGERRIIDEIDSIGFPDWNLFDVDKYVAMAGVNASDDVQEQLRLYPLNSARGCPFNCTFCYHVFKKCKYRRCSPDFIIEEIKRLHDIYECNFISFWDELTFDTIQSVNSFLDALEKLDFSIKWEVSTRGNLFKTKDIDTICRMKSLGCHSVAFSLENASPQILNAMNKKMNVDEFIEQSEILWKGGIIPLTSVIFGYPQETPETIKNTIQVCEDCNIFPSVGFLLPLPGTPIYEWAKTNGYINNEVAYLKKIGDRQDFHLNLTQMEDVEFIKIVTKNLVNLAKKQGLELNSVFKTTTYQKPKTDENCNI